MEDVTDEQHDRTTCCYPPATIGYEVEEYYDTSGEKYGVISVKEKTPPEEESREDRESSTESDDANKSSMVCLKMWFSIDLTPFLSLFRAYKW